ncbi:hypothetical protein JHK82_043185 [Glycine max]|nr:hypothetical protein JHK85_043858 [Glycine max]KAG5106215.1 hypothetical protein JHK82_043185 [Glycine max]
MTGRICWKSPPKTMTLPPKIVLSFELYLSSKIGIGILNFECAVLLPGNSREAMPLEATIITILLSALSELASVFQMYVFPVPPYP